MSFLQIIIVLILSLLAVSLTWDFLRFNFSLHTTATGAFFRLFFTLATFFFFFYYYRLYYFFFERLPINLDIFLKYFSLLNLIIFFIFVLLIFFAFHFAFFIFKYNFLKLHYFLMYKYTISSRYCVLFYFISTWPKQFIFFLIKKKINILRFKKIIYYFFKYGFDLVIIFLFIFDVVNSGKILITFTIVLPYYSFYKFFLNVSLFVINMEYLHDILIMQILYQYSNYEKQLYSKNSDIPNISTYIRSILLKNYLFIF